MIKGCYNHKRFKDIWDTVAETMHDVCYDIETEPLLQLLVKF